MVDIFQDRATVRKQKIAELMTGRAAEKADRKAYRQKAKDLDASGYANFYFMWGIDDDSEQPIREMQRVYLDRLEPGERADFVARMTEMRREKIKTDYRAAVAGDRIVSMSAEISRLQWTSRKEAAAKLLDRVFHWH